MKWKCVNFANTVLNLKLLALFVKQNNRNAIKFVCPCRKTLTFFDAFIPYFLCYVRCVLVQCANVKWTVSKIKLHAVRSICWYMVHLRRKNSSLNVWLCHTHTHTHRCTYVHAYNITFTETRWVSLWLYIHSRKKTVY
jgi:hypothetical protein